MRASIIVPSGIQEDERLSVTEPSGLALMGTEGVGLARLKAVAGTDISDNDCHRLARIPFSETTIWCRRATHVLLPVIPLLVPNCLHALAKRGYRLGGTLTVQEIVDACRARPAKWSLLRGTPSVSTRDSVSEFADLATAITFLALFPESKTSRLLSNYVRCNVGRKGCGWILLGMPQPKHIVVGTDAATVAVCPVHYAVEARERGPS
jgi:hypothetical protein